MMTVEQQIRRLIHQEGLDDIATLVSPREWDEVPLVSRVSRRQFLAHLDVHEQSRVLLSGALNHLKKILEFLEAKDRKDTIVMLSLLDWEELNATDPSPVIPNFWISTDPGRDLASFRARVGSTQEANIARSWLQVDERGKGYEVLDPAVLPSDPDLRRVYIVSRESAFLDSIIAG